MSKSGATYQFGNFTFDPGNARLSRDGRFLHAEPKALQVLEILLKSGGSLVDRDALFDQVWGRVVVTTGTLTRLIAELRRLLGDDSLKPRFIETIHTKGYRWMAPATLVGAPFRRSGPPERSIELIGRADDLDKLERLASGARLLTLAGPGGTGKTQLALEYARRCESRQPNSVVWIDLTAAGDARALPALIAAGLDVQIPASEDFAAGVARAIGERAVLLLLDNCEHVIGALAPLVRGVLGRCAHASIVCTTQAMLDLPEETVFWVAPLALPPGSWESADNPVSRLLDSAAVRLLTERAHAVSPYFELTLANAPFVVAICRRLDGLPLALELAAARLAILSPPQLLSALDDRFGLLSRQSAGPQARHGSLRHAIEWSYELLEDRERDLLDCFGAFYGSWSLEAALAVAGGSAKAGAILDGIQSLVQKSLVIVERSADQLRYRLLDSVRAFACARLAAMGHEEAIRARHAVYFSGLAMNAAEELLGKNQVPWMDHLDGEWANLRAAWEWLQERPQHRALAIGLLIGLRWHFWIRGRYAEASQWYAEARGLIEDCAAGEQARLLNGYAIAMIHALRLDDAVSLSARAAQSAAACHLGWEEAFAVGAQSWAESIIGRYGEALRLATQAKQLAERCQDAWLDGFCALGAAFIPIYRMHAADAITEMRPVADLFDRADDDHMRMFVAVQMALQEFLSNNVAASRRWALQALETTRRIDNPRGFTAVCETAAYITAREGNAATAARLLGAAEAGRRMSGAPQARFWVAPHKLAWDEVCARIGVDAAERLQLAGLRQGPRASSGLAMECLSTPP